jgi:hypothetical protein
MDEVVEIQKQNKLAEYVRIRLTSTCTHDLTSSQYCKDMITVEIRRFHKCAPSVRLLSRQDFTVT